MTDEKFVDGILGVGFGKGAVRLDFYTLSADAVDEAGHPVKERTRRLVMTAEVFLETYAMLTTVVEKMRAAAPRSPAAPGKAPAGGEPAPGSVSPNF